MSHSCFPPHPHLHHHYHHHHHHHCHHDPRENPSQLLLLMENISPHFRKNARDWTSPSRPRPRRPESSMLNRNGAPPPLPPRSMLTLVGSIESPILPRSSGEKSVNQTMVAMQSRLAGRPSTCKYFRNFNIEGGGGKGERATTSGRGWGDGCWLHARVRVKLGRNCFHQQSKQGHTINNLNA